MQANTHTRTSFGLPSRLTGSSAWAHGAYFAILRSTGLASAVPAIMLYAAEPWLDVSRSQWLLALCPLLVTPSYYVQPLPAVFRPVTCAVQDNRLNSLSITAASRAGRSSSSGSRLWSAGAAVIRRMSVFGRSGLLSTSMRAPADPGSHATLHVSVRIGIATGRLPYGCDLNNCAVKDRAKSEWLLLGWWGWCGAVQRRVASTAAAASGNVRSRSPALALTILPDKRSTRLRPAVVTLVAVLTGVWCVCGVCLRLRLLLVAQTMCLMSPTAGRSFWTNTPSGPSRTP